jgi:hypothetical protein
MSVEQRFVRIETTEKWRGLDTPAENAGYSTDFFNTPLIKEDPWTNPLQSPIPRSPCGEEP